MRVNTHGFTVSAIKMLMTLHLKDGSIQSKHQDINAGIKLPNDIYATFTTLILSVLQGINNLIPCPLQNLCQ
jgi:hypothetical protein